MPFISEHNENWVVTHFVLLWFHLPIWFCMIIDFFMMIHQNLGWNHSLYTNLMNSTLIQCLLPSAIIDLPCSFRETMIYHKILATTKCMILYQFYSWLNGQIILLFLLLFIWCFKIDLYGFIVFILKDFILSLENNLSNYGTTMFDS